MCAKILGKYTARDERSGAGEQRTEFGEVRAADTIGEDVVMNEKRRNSAGLVLAAAVVAPCAPLQFLAQTSA